MNIFTRIKNNCKYAYYRKLRDKSLAKMKKHMCDTDDLEFKKWEKLCLESTEKCLNTPIK